jgi:2'-5' RNA ligase
MKAVYLTISESSEEIYNKFTKLSLAMVRDAPDDVNRGHSLHNFRKPSDFKKRFAVSKEKFHITFLYFGDIFNNLSAESKDLINSLIDNIKYFGLSDTPLIYNKLSLFGRFIVAEFTPSSDLIEMRKTLLSNIYNIINEENCTIASDFLKKNYVQGLTYNWKPHITLGGIERPSEQWCYGKLTTVEKESNKIFEFIENKHRIYLEGDNFKYDIESCKITIAKN